METNIFKNDENSLQSKNCAFDCGPEPLGLYPIVDRATWLEKLLPLGVTTIQLRIKDLQGAALEQEIKQSISLARQYSARLFINDYWQLAILHGAYGIHLGQEDLNVANIAAIYQAGLRLGISTHSDDEVERACAVKPSYIAFGPVYSTTSKIMSYGPQGIDQLKYRVCTLNYKIVAIGGINRERLPDVLATGVDGIALISAITHSEDPIATTQEFLKIIKCSRPC